MDGWTFGVDGATPVCFLTHSPSFSTSHSPLFVVVVVVVNAPFYFTMIFVSPDQGSACMPKN